MLPVLILSIHDLEVKSISAGVRLRTSSCGAHPCLPCKSSVRVHYCTYGTVVPNIRRGLRETAALWFELCTLYCGVRAYSVVLPGTVLYRYVRVEQLGLIEV